jgi:hypothetical protein
MSEEPINRKDDVEQDIRDTADHVEEGLDEAGDTIKAGAKAMGNKIKVQMLTLVPITGKKS